MTEEARAAKKKRQAVVYKTRGNIANLANTKKDERKVERKIRYGAMVDKVQGGYRHNGIWKGQ